MNNLITDLKSEDINLLKGKKILLYGAGSSFRKIIQIYPLLDLNIVAIADQNFNNPTEYMGIPAISPNDIKNYDFELLLATVPLTAPKYKKITETLKYELNIKQDIFYFKDIDNLINKLNPETDTEKIIKLLYKIQKSLEELDTNKSNTQFSPHYMRKKQAAEQTLEYITTNAANALVFPAIKDVRRYCMNYFLNKEKSIQGLFLEFGVFKGGTINFFSEILPDQKFYGFDSFEGLPSDWQGTAGKKGTFSLKKDLPYVNKNVELIAGWFEETLPAFLEKNKENVAFLHIDCDLYSSTKTILDNLSSRIQPGTIILFDEYFNYPNWQEHEYKAFQEFVRDNNIKYEYIAIGHTQVAVKIL